MKRKYIADLTAGEIEEALVAGARKFNAECIRLGISRVHEIDGVTVLAHPDGSRTPIPEDDEEAEKFLDRYKVSLRDVPLPLSGLAAQCSVDRTGPGSPRPSRASRNGDIAQGRF